MVLIYIIQGFWVQFPPLATPVVCYTHPQKSGRRNENEYVKVKVCCGKGMIYLDLLDKTCQKITKLSNIFSVFNKSNFKLICRLNINVPTKLAKEITI